VEGTVVQRIQLAIASLARLTLAPNASAKTSTPSITGEVYNDLDGDGSLDPGELGLEGWVVSLVASGFPEPATLSSANGTFTFSDVAPTVYTVEEVLQPGWAITQPAAPSFYQVGVTSDSSATVDFGNFQLINAASASGEVCDDLNGNGSLDPGNRALPGPSNS
jgi:hypothetical protein